MERGYRGWRGAVASEINREGGESRSIGEELDGEECVVATASWVAARVSPLVCFIFFL